MKIFLSILILGGISCFQDICAQNSLSGRITDAKDSKPLIGAIVSIPDLKTGVVTDVDGNYKLLNLPKGNLLVDVKFIGYKGISKFINISGVTVADFSMTTAAIETEEIVITGVSTATEMKRLPVPMSLVSKSELLQSSSSNIIEALSVPGIYAVSTGQGIAKPVIRGLGYNRVVVVNDGMRQEGQQWGDEHGIEIDEYSANKVEILKGPGSIMYGSDALAGVINILSPDPVAIGKISGNIFANYQTNNGLAGYSASVTGNQRGFVWLGRFSQKYAHAYQNAYDGYVLNSGFRETDGGGYIGLNKKWGYSHLNFSFYHSTLGLVEGDRDSSGAFIKEVAVNDSTTEETEATENDFKSYKPLVPYQEIGYYKVSLMNNFYLGNTKLYFNIGYAQSSRQEYGDALAPDDYGLFFLLQTIPYDLRFTFPKVNNLNISVGVNGMSQVNENKGTEFLVPAYHLFDAGAYTFVTRNFDKLSLSGGVRYDNRSINTKQLILNEDEEPVDELDSLSEIKFAGAKSFFSNVSASLGGSYEVSKKIIVKLNIVRGFRAPNIAEIGANGRHEGTFRYEIGSPNLKAETSLQFDASLGFNTDYVSGEINLFQNNIQHFIFPEKLNSVSGGDSLRIVDGETVPVYQFVQGDASLTGGEISLDIHPKPISWLHFENSFSYVQSLQKGQSDSTKYLPFTPAPRLQSVLRTNGKKLGKFFRNTYAEVGITYFFSQTHVYSAYGTETPSSNYMLINAGLGSDIVSQGKTLFTIIIGVSNLTDVAYQDHLSRLKYAAVNPVTGRSGVFNMGRNISVKLNVPLEIKK